jgi:hypothetical protein
MGRRVWVPAFAGTTILDYFYPTGKSMRPALVRLSSPFNKNILIFRNSKSVYIRGIPRSQEGRFAVVTDVGCGMRWTRQCRCTRVRRRTILMRTAKSCGPDAPTLVSSLRDFFANDGGKKARSPGSNCVLRRPVIGRPQGWRCAPPPSAADGLDPVRSPVFWLCMRSVLDRARSTLDQLTA